jgi:alpha-tubulin suppressor-like RCC1 family protein
MNAKMGEIYLCSQDSDGEPILLKNFKGVKISTITGGHFRAFVLEAAGDSAGKIHSLHPPEYDEYDYTFTEKNPEDLALLQREVEDELNPASHDPRAALPADRREELGEPYTAEDYLQLERDGREASSNAGKHQLSAVAEEDRDEHAEHEHFEKKHEAQEYNAESEARERATEMEVETRGARLSEQLNAQEIEEIDAKKASAIYSAFDGKGDIQDLRCGKNHVMLLNKQGHLFSYGYGEYGMLGRGRQVYTSVPTKIQNLVNQKVEKVVCGYHHTLALTSGGDIYSWGRGFEGQLGLEHIPASDPKHPDKMIIQTTSFPRVLKYFVKMRYELETQYYRKGIKNGDLSSVTVANIETGAYHSVAITAAGKLFGWGDSGCGQLGIGKKPRVLIPAQIPIKEKVIGVAAGYAHSVVLTKEGFLYTFGLNHKYQLGFDDQKSRFAPEMLIQDEVGNPIPRIVKVTSGDYNSFALSDTGKVFSWGSGILGLKEIFTLTRPKHITGSISDRRITDIYANSGNVIFFSPIKILSIRPSCGPSNGGTIFSILGTGLCDLQGRQKIRFTFGKDNFSVDAPLKYDENTNSFLCKAPNFEEACKYETMEWPQKAKVQVTLDDSDWIETDLEYFIYGSKVKVTTITPRFASIEGGIEMVIELLADNKTMKEFRNVSVGFQATNRSAMESNEAKEEGKKAELKTEALNPVDLAPNSPELERENWVYFDARVEEKKIVLEVPPMSRLIGKSLYYNVDVSLNGQQFLGTPIYFRYYDIHVSKIEPDNTVVSGGTKIKITGYGFIDSNQKKIKLTNSKTERLIDAKWEKDEEYFYFYTPPISWLSGTEEEVTKEMIKEISNEKINIFLTISGKDWISIGQYSFYEPKINLILPGPIPDKTNTEEAIRANWQKEEAVVNPLEGVAEKDLEKKKVELEKRLKEEINEIENFFRKPHSLVYLEGENFLKNGMIAARCVIKEHAYPANVVFKNHKRLGLEVPLMEGPPEGVHEAQVELSFNGGQQFYNPGAHSKIKYYCFNKTTPEADRIKLMDAEIKNAKKPPAKK